MILNTGNRTDIPAFYSKWFINRIKEGYVYARNPYHPQLIIKYILNPELVDIICFCTKNPIPMLSYMHELKDYRMFWQVTLTAYGKDIEPYLINKNQVIKAIIELSKKLGSSKVYWRYDPILITDKYTKAYHYEIFEKICKKLEHSIHTCIISFFDIYPKMKDKTIYQEVDIVTRKEMIQKLSSIASKYGIKIKTCLENEDFYHPYADTSGCMTKEILEEAINLSLQIPESMKTRKGCACVLGNDIGMYDTCPHGCRYCYANTSEINVRENYKNHDPYSPLLIGYPSKEDKIVDAKQKSIISKQLSIFDKLFE